MRMRNNGKPRAGVSFRTPRPEAPRRGVEEPAPSLSRGRFSGRRAGGALWAILRDAKLRFAPEDEVRDLRLRLAPLDEVSGSRCGHRGRGRVSAASVLAALIA